MKEYNNREEVPIEYRCDLSDYFNHMEDWNKEYELVSKELDKIDTYRDCLKDAKRLEEYLTFDERLNSRILNLFVYAYVSSDLDLKNNEYKDIKNKMYQLDSIYEQKDSFFQSDLVKLTKEEYNHLFKENSHLEKYRFLLDELYRQKDHVLNEEEEQILAQITETFGQYEDISSNLINNEHQYGNVVVDGKKIIIASNNVRHLKQNRDESVRKTVTNKFGKVLEQYQGTSASLLNAFVKNNINMAHIRHYKSPWDAHIENIYLPNEVFESLKNVAHEQIPVLQEYYQLMKDALGLKVLHSYDTLLAWNKCDKTYTIEDAQRLVEEGTKPLGKTYQERLLKIFRNHYIDYCQYKGKVSGGYSISTNDHDSRIVLSYNGNYNDILTIAHECGHNVHHQYVQSHNDLCYRDVPPFIAEVASLTNEFLVNGYMAKNGKTKEERLMGIENALKTFENNFFGAVMEGEMECEMYSHVEQGNTLSSDYLDKLASKELELYEGNKIKRNEYSPLMWVTRSHYYMTFYLYSYAICVSIASILAKRILEGDKDIVMMYENYLYCGGNMFPVAIYQKLGVDITKKKVFEEAVDYFKSQIDLYYKLLKEDE